MAASMMFNQQVAVPHSKGWSSGFFDCCLDIKSCCYGFWCFPCFACTTTGDFGQCLCLPLLDILTPAAVVECGCPIIVPPATLAMRVAVRNKYDIVGSLCDDIVVSCFCMWCSWCQLAREIKHHKKNSGIINVQPITFNIQPPAMAAPQVNVMNAQANSSMAAPQVNVMNSQANSSMAAPQVNVMNSQASSAAPVHYAIASPPYAPRYDQQFDQL